jgi:xanthine dehydrogenase YagS FAD-binding subunit
LDVQSAVGLLGDRWGKVEILAGGSDLLALLKEDIVAPSQLVNIKKIAGLRSFSADAVRGLSAGCLVTLDELAHDKGVSKLYPALTEAISDAASPQIRNMATLGGNLCQRPRCWYFRNGYGLLAQDAKGESLVLKGDNRYHAILGNQGPAYFVSPSTIAPVLVALGAELEIVGPDGPRSILLEHFYRIPKKPTEREHDLAPNEVVTRLTVPPPAPGAVTAYYEVRQKHGFDWPAATATVSIITERNAITRASVVLGHVAPVPWRSAEAETALIGKTMSEAIATSASIAALKPAKDLGQNGYKIQIARVALKRAFLKAAQIPAPPAQLRGSRS